MKAYSIVLHNNEISERGFSILTESNKKVKNDFDICRFDAITAGEVTRTLNYTNLRWNWPTEESILDKETNLIKTPYTTRTPAKRIACALSHYMLWFTTRQTGEPSLILEHDAIFTNKFEEPPQTKFEIIGINDPRGATRKASLYHDLIQKCSDRYQDVPKIDEHDVPQGLAGNSAYYITPEGANFMINLVLKYGLWPNDAIMCYQLVPRLGVSRSYYTKVQGLESTTSL